MKNKVSSDQQLSILKPNDKIYNNKKTYSVSSNDSESKEMEMHLLGGNFQADLGIGAYTGTVSVLKKSYQSIIADEDWEIEE